MAPPPRPRVFLDLSLNGAPAGRVTIELFADVVPRTAENFRALCTGEAGVSKVSGARLHYKGSVFHRCVSGFMLQGGDFTAGNGTGGESIYGPTFADEAFTEKHTAPGLLSMANAGPDTNGSQFFITTAPAPWLDGKHVAFGRVVSGLAVVRAVDKAASSQSGAPRARVVVADCGEAAAGGGRAGGGGGGAASAVLGALADDDPDAASRARLARLMGSGGGGGDAALAPPPPRLPVRTAQDDLAEAAAAEAAAEAAAIAGAAAAAGAAAGEGEGPAPPAPAPLPAPASAREAKLAGLKARLAAARKANAGAAIAETKREAVRAGRGDGGGGGDGGDDPSAPSARPAGGGTWKKWAAAQEAETAATLARAGLGADKAYLLRRPAPTDGDEAGPSAAASGGGKKRKKGGRGGGQDGIAWGNASLAAAYDRRVALTVGPDAIAAAQAAAAAAAGGGGPSASNPPPPEALDRLVAGLDAAARGRAASSRRRPPPPGAGGGISAPNAAFNDKLQKAYGGVAAEIKANLERGTALPD